MDFLNLDSRSSKLQKEQQKRRDAAKLRIQRERRSKEAAARDQAKIEEQIRARKLEQRQKEEEVRKQEEADQIRTAGVRYKESLLAVVADGEGDKLLLPPSALESLSSQDAVSMGPMLFELTWTKPGQQRAGEKSDSVTRTTHAGVLEFVANEGTVGLPRKVVLSLLGATVQQVPFGNSGEKEDPLHHRKADRPATDGGGSGSDADGGGAGDQQGAAARPAVEGLGSVVVRYVRLAKATFARVVPETVGLSQVSELRAMLEHNMRNHATLTVGDRLSVWRRGKEFSVKVVELRPEPQVTVIDTDMEIELDLPEEAKEKLEEKSAQDRAKTMRAHMAGGTMSAAGQSLSLPANAVAGGGGVVLGGGRTLADSGSASGSGSGSGSGRASPMDESEDDSDLDSDDEDSAGAKNTFDPEKHRLVKLQELPEEPDRLDDGVFTCQLRSSQGKNARRFRFGDRLEVLLDFAEALGGVPGQYRLLIPFPRRVLTREDAAAGMTLREAGLTSKQESVIVERV